MYYSKANIYINEEYMILFDLVNYDIFKIDNENFKIIKKINNIKENEIIKLNSKELEIYNMFFDRSINSSNWEIETVKIHVSNTCNLKCKYCYANQGNYGIENSIMSIDSAMEICKFIKKNIKNLKTITFFGGEPLLAIDSIKFICEEFNDLNLNFLLQTNGTILDDSIIELINRYNIKFTVSLDGDKEINDINRLYKNNKGTYDDIIKNINKINDETKNSLICIQGTYTKESKENFSKYDLIKHLKEVSNAKIIKLEDVCSDKENFQIKNNIDKCSDEHLNKLFEFIEKDSLFITDDITTFLRCFFTKSEYNDNLCEAGKSNITIDTNGNLWPCQLFVNKDEYFMGNIEDGLENLNFEKVQHKLKSVNKSSDLECTKCIAKCFCGSCIGKAAILSNESIYNFKSFGVNCNYRKDSTYKVLDRLSKYISENRFEEFNKRLWDVIDI